MEKDWTAGNFKAVGIAAIKICHEALDKNYEASYASSADKLTVAVIAAWEQDGW